MKIATWNVNSLKVRLPQVLDWLASAQPDALCLQELKLEDAAFPLAEIEEAGYHAVFNGQKTYNGVAILSREKPENVVRDIPGFDDVQKRIIAANIGPLRIICGYFPNGQSLDSDKFVYKMRWLEALTAWVESEIAAHPKLVLTGDFNIAPEARDAHPEWPHEIHVSPRERAAFQKLTDLGLIDPFWLFEQPGTTYSWWDYRMGAFRRNLGLRIDHLLVTANLRPALTGCFIDAAPRKLQRPSDHAPVVLTLEN